MSELFLVASKLLPILVFPLTVAVVLLLLSLAPWPRARVPLLATALGVLLLGSCGPAARELARGLEWQYLPPRPVPQADAIVLLGGASVPAVFPRAGVEVTEAADRIFAAARLFHAGRASKILVAGGRFDHREQVGAESDDLAAMLVELGVPEAAILRETKSRNTYENAMEASRILPQRRILLVTSALHMPRAVGLFRHHGFEVVPYPVDFTVTEELESEWGGWLPVFHRIAPDAETLAYTTRVLREYLGLWVYRLRGWID